MPPDDIFEEKCRSASSSPGLSRLRLTSTDKAMWDGVVA